MTTLDLTPATKTGGSFPSLASMTSTRFVVEMKTFLRSKEAWIWILAYPTFMFVIFNFVMGDTVNMGTDFTATFGQVFLPGMIATGLLNASFQTVAADVVTEREYGTLRRLSVTPLSPAAYIMGKVGMVLTTAVVQLVILLAVAVLAFDVTLPTEPTLWLRFAWLVVLSLAVGTVGGIAFSGLMRSAKAANAFVPAVALILQFISGVFFLPFGEMPEVGQYIANVFPLRWMALGMRSIFWPEQFVVAETGESWQTGLTAIILVVWFVLALAVTMRTFKWRSKADG
ncbi:MAG: ABC transporter permease [Promicromonosporaceae bacterium]|nr:ABC transporter permease [Promicromonosporaceae bacterium]